MKRQRTKKEITNLPVAQQAAADYISTGSVTLTYGGRRIIPTPGELLFDRVLSDGEKICWMALRACVKHYPASRPASAGGYAGEKPLLHQQPPQKCCVQHAG